jgi:hypothetical protein
VSAGDSRPTAATSASAASRVGSLPESMTLPPLVTDQFQTWRLGQCQTRAAAPGGRTPVGSPPHMAR